jgi:AcrR family transcriptional regulator
LEHARPRRASWPSTPRRPERDPYEDPIIVAFVEVVDERGYEAASLEEVVARSGVTAAEFHRRFAGKEDCAQQSFEALTDDWRFRVYSAYSAFPDWRSGLRAAAYEVADWMEEHPAVVHFGIVEILKAENEMIRVRREEALTYGGELIDGGRREAADPDKIPEAAPLMAIGSIVQLLTHRLQTGVPVEPTEMVPQMMHMATRPYIGEELAREEYDLPRPIPPSAAATER